MATVLLVIHLMVAAALVGVVLLQKSEGGALGIGGGGGGGGFLTGRGTANLLTRTTAGLALCFFITSLALTIVATRGSAPTSVFDKSGTAPSSAAPGKAGEGKAGESRGGILDKLQAPAGGPAIPQTK